MGKSLCVPAACAVVMVGRLVMAQVPATTDGEEKRRKLELLRDTQDEAAMRVHAWKTLMSITDEISGRARWETWPQAKEVYTRVPPEDPLRPCEPQGKPKQQLRGLALESPPQLEPLEKDEAPAVERSLAQSVHFHPSARKHVRDQKLYEPLCLDQLRVKGGHKFIASFPRDAVVVKAIWWPVKRGAPSCIPVWDGVPRHTDPGGTRTPKAKRRCGTNRPVAPRNGFSTWRRLLTIDPNSGPSVPTAVVPPAWWNGPRLGQETSVVVETVPIDRFYVHPITPHDCEDADTWKQLQRMFCDVLGENCADDDMLALVGLHVATKELDDWVWMTFWWHDQPNYGRFAANRPQDLKDPWPNYLMDVTFSGWTPRELDGGPNITFNPWLEAGMVDGIHSNCLSCHQRAAWCLDATLSYVPPCPYPVDDRYFNNLMRVDYMWSIFREGERKKGCEDHHPTPRRRRTPQP
ncbi:MAG: hypothetical protein PVI86_09105 [Phycisphaerae bacterium]